MNGKTFRKSNSLLFPFFASHLISGQVLKNLKKEICSPWSKFFVEQILSFKGRPYLERAALSRKANRKSYRLFPFVKMVRNHDCLLIHLNMEN